MGNPRTHHPCKHTQVDLARSSIRPGQPRAWLDALSARCAAAVRQAASQGTTVQVHVGSWLHDLEQGRLLPQEAVKLQVYGVESHRLALLLDKQGKLLPLVGGVVRGAIGLRAGDVRLTNLV